MSRSQVDLFKYRSPFLTVQQGWRWLQRSLGLAGLSLAFTAQPSLSAEQIYLSYGILERSIPIRSLETYVRDGTIDQELQSYARYVSPQQLELLGAALNTEIDLTPVAVSQFLYTPQGEALLQRLGQLIQTESRQPGFYALRSALILAAADPNEGLTLLNILKQFPLEGIRIDLEQSSELLTTLRQAVNQTTAAITVIEQEAEEAAIANPISNPLALPNPSAAGPFDWQQESFQLTDTRRDRAFLVDFYLPLPDSGRASNPYPAPLVVISHGLGNDRSSYAYLARHLASHGFAVAVPEHPGSSAEQLQALITGRESAVTEPDEFINRPLDISYLLDSLEQRLQTDPALQGQLDLSNIGMIGQSFGGYTVLALAGAPINFQSLRTECFDLTTSLNLSLLLQCQARFISNPTVHLADERIKAAIAINPVGSVVFGPEGFQQIQTPLMIISGNGDTVAPALPEQIRPFTWLENPERYLLLIRGSTHFSTIGDNADNTEVVPLPPDVIGPDPQLAKRYVRAMSLAFLETYLQDNSRYQPLLTAAYANFLGEAPLPLSLVKSLSAVQLKAAIASAGGDAFGLAKQGARKTPGQLDEKRTEAQNGRMNEREP